MGGLDTIVVSAGAGGRTPIFDTDPDEFQRIIDHNLRPAFLAMRYGAEHLVAAKASVIVISSTYGLSVIANAPPIARPRLASSAW